MRTSVKWVTAATGAIRRAVRNAVGLLAAGFALASPLAGGAAAAPLSDPTEFEVKAAFVYNFAKFAAWPEGAFAGPRATLVLCRLGDVGFGSALSALEGKPVGERRLAVRDVMLREAGDCHLLVIGAPLESRLADVARIVKGRPILTIGDAEGFAAHGGAIGLTLDDGRVRFEVNPKALAGSGITLSSQLLRLARIVEDVP
ncbi:YfiR family protein [Azospirillum sp.]|uniref:YfiR family protein n=1 Tax=Azospirillum sp. TaxID=34012 RepID=UPI003D730802